MKKWIIICIVLGSMSGCIKTLTPEGKPQYHLDPCSPVLKTAEDAAEAAIGIIGILGAFWPVLGAVAVAGTTGYATWRKIKPKLTKARSEAEMFHTVASCTVIAIDDFKKAYPDEWNKLLVELESVKDGMINPQDLLKLNNLIRGLRGLPPKE